MIEIIIAQLLWILNASLEGFIQAYYYSLYPSDKGYKNLHPFFLIQRIILIAGLTFGLGYTLEAWMCAVFIAACAFTYSFFHNGFYYLTRNKLDSKVYPKGFLDDTDTSDAILNINLGFRIIMAIIGIVFTIGLILEMA